MARSIELNALGGLLADEDSVPDAPVTVVLLRLPWQAAEAGAVKDLGGGELEIAGEERKSKSNALCELGFASGTEYFEVEVLEGEGAFIGVATRAGFAEGYKLRGLFFGGPGNLSDGRGGLRTSFGNPVKKGSVIGAARLKEVGSGIDGSPSKVGCRTVLVHTSLQETRCKA